MGAESGVTEAVSAATTSSQCFVCNRGIREATSEVDGKLALWYEGRHKQRAHARCIGVSNDLYQSLQDSSIPWACVSCMQEALKAYHSLPHLQQALASLQDMVSALSVEVALLKQSATAGNAASPHPRQQNITPGTAQDGEATDTSTESQQPWSTIVRRGRGHRPHHQESSRSALPSPNENRRSSSDEATPERVQEGVGSGRTTYSQLEMKCATLMYFLSFKRNELDGK